MKVFIYVDKEPEGLLHIKSTHFEERNRETVRKYIMQIERSRFVWFEGESVPPEIIDMLESIANEEN